MSNPNSENSVDVGQGRTHVDATQKYDQQHGTAADVSHTIPTEDRLPTVCFPLASEAAPFVLGPLAPGKRE